MARKQSIHYVNNATFSQAVVDYVSYVEKCKKEQEPLPKVPDYIAQCFLRIAEGLSHKANFIRYTYREEMVMDAVENCLKAISNYKSDELINIAKELNIDLMKNGKKKVKKELYDEINLIKL